MLAFELDPSYNTLTIKVKENKMPRHTTPEYAMNTTPEYAMKLLDGFLLSADGFLLSAADKDQIRKLLNTLLTDAYKEGEIAALERLASYDDPSY